MTRGAAAHQHQLTWSLRIPFDWLTMNRLFTTFVLQLILVDQCQAIRNLRIASPLQALTIWDPEAKEEAASSRSRFLPRFKAGLEAEAKTRKKLAAKRQQRLQADATSSDWAKRAAAAERQTRESDERIIERAFDEAVQKYDALHEKAQKNPNENKYQFVGIVNPAGSSSSDKPITWYARKKPADANWSLRLIHVNKQAIVKDLFNRGKVDIFAKYENTGDRDPETNQPLVTSKYTVRERSWKNLWNFNPVHLFTDSSGMYWRERRLRPGLYTDGKSVYEATYRYRDGRNGMHRLSTFEKFLSSKAIDPTKKEKIVKRLKDDVPDVVLEL